MEVPSKAAADKFLKMLESNKSLEALQEIAALSPDKRRAAIARPAPFFRKAGLKPPRGVTLTIVEKSLDLDETPAGPGGQPPLARPDVVCFWVLIEISQPFTQPYYVQTLVCVRVNVGPFGEVTVTGGGLF